MRDEADKVLVFDRPIGVEGSGGAICNPGGATPSRL
jgi:hypothetical protein